ncbi:MAG: septum formation initiator family protein [Micrococcales bacterium]|nr:MAG: septum formation initiator family protein [Micrococcales bacterium]PIE26507.1 MAG: septum formation initiator family protein [Micrococcales bacterium]
MPVSHQDIADVAQQLGRPPRGIVDVAYRCEHDIPAVVVTAPRLPDGTPFPTTFYLTCARLVADTGTLESSGLMSAMTRRLRTDVELAAAYRAAHEDYLRRRAQIASRVGTGEVGEIAGISAGGMPTRVKCLHVLVAHALAAGPGVNPLGDETVRLLGPCPGPMPDQDAEEDR